MHPAFSVDIVSCLIRDVGTFLWSSTGSPPSEMPNNVNFMWRPLKGVTVLPDVEPLQRSQVLETPPPTGAP